MTDGAPRIFHISPDLCGGERLVEMFEASGHRAVFHQKGRIAADITYQRARWRAPLAGWPHARLFSGLFRIGPPGRPPLEAWRDFAYLRQYFTDAVFILTTRDVNAWLLDRMAAEGGATARAYAVHLGLPEDELPEHWAVDWFDHQRAVTEFFGEDPRLVRIDLDRETPQDAAERLSPFIELRTSGSDRRWHPATRGRIEDQLMAVFDHAAIREPQPDDEAYIRDVAGFCLRGLSVDADVATDTVVPKGVSQFYCAWDGARRVTGPDGEPQPIALAPAAGRGTDIAITEPGAHFKLARAEQVINEILRLGRRDPVRIDMEDSRWIGSDHGETLERPVICHNRRADARNVVLWPLPGSHDIGQPGLETTGCTDRIPFDDKLDRVVWRGMISGSEMRETVRQGPAAHVFLRQMIEAETGSTAHDDAWEALSRTNRLAFIRKWFGHPDFDLGVVLAWGFRELAKDPLLAPLCTLRQPPAFFHRYRYHLCLAGYDHASNFLSAINSQSVLLKEQDGWEVYYSGRFKPWKHFIPLARFGADVAEKLAWARENPNECKRMSRAASDEALRLADPLLRRAILARILDGLAG